MNATYIILKIDLFILERSEASGYINIFIGEWLLLNETHNIEKSFINQKKVHHNMAKCDICNQKIQTTFLSKLVGTVVKKEGKPKHVCSACQQEHKGKDLSTLV